MRSGVEMLCRRFPNERQETATFISEQNRWRHGPHAMPRAAQVRAGGTPLAPSDATVVVGRSSTAAAARHCSASSMSTYGKCLHIQMSLLQEPEFLPLALYLREPPSK